MTPTAISEIKDAAVALGGAIRSMREQRSMSLADLSKKVSGMGDGIRIGSRTIELVESGTTDAQLDHMLMLLSAVGIDMKMPNSVSVPRYRLIEVRLAEIRRALYEARHPKGFRKISFKALSATSGIEQGQIGKIESGDAIPRFRTVMALTRALGLDVRFLPVNGNRAGNTATAAKAATMSRGRLRTSRARKAA